MIAIVVSRADRASEHIGAQLLETADWTGHDDSDRPDADGGGTYYVREGMELREFEDLHIYLDDPTPAFTGGAEAVELLVFVSRHSGETGPLLTAHFTGNFGPAEYGGETGEFARAAPAAQRQLVDAFERFAPAGYDVGIECTHHGPSPTAVPSLFAELGSGEPQWDDPDGARAVARAVLELPGPSDPADVVGVDGRARHVVGFGGGHYAPRFTRLVTETAWGVGHVGSDWQLAEMGDPGANTAVLERAFGASGAHYAVVEGEKPELVTILEELGYRVVSETWIREVDDRPLAMVGALEDDVASVADGLRFGNPGAGADAAAPPTNTDEARDRYVVRDLPAELLAQAQGIDPETTRKAVEARAIAFETEQAGARAAGTAAFPDEEARGALAADLARVLRGKFDAVDVDRERGVVVAHENAFDPALAAERGVPEGPAFGRLASGEAVDVDGETIEPATVRREREERFPF